MNVPSSSAACVWLSVLLLAGCSDSKPTGRLHGTVTLDGTPVSKAVLQLQSPATGTAAAVELNDEGAFRFDRPLEAGDYRATVTPIVDVPEAGLAITPATSPQASVIPQRYHTLSSTDLVVTIQAGENTLDVKLTK